MNIDSKISIVIPAYNEEGNIVPIVQKIKDVIDKKYNYEIIFVNDGSSDNTLKILRKMNKENCNIHYLSLSRNYGHQTALRAGIDHSKGDCIITMDADLQHPPELINQMIEKWKDGFDVVYTQRIEDKNLPFLKRKSSNLFYKFMNSISDIKMEPGTADFRLIDKRIALLIKNSKENNLFIRGFISWLGFNQHRIIYSPNERFSGETKYTLKKMWSFAINGITSFSIKPLHLATILGLIISVSAFLYSLYAVFVFFLTDYAIAGWTSVLVSILFIGGLQLLTLGVIGEYIGKIFIQSKERPEYLVQENDNGKFI